MAFLAKLLVAITLCCSLASVVAAHPHVYVEARSELVYDDTAHFIGVNHAWIFDEAFSVYAVQGLDSKKDGKYTREDLSELAKTNVESLNEFDYFSFGKSSGKKLEFTTPKDPWLEYNNKKLTLHFYLPLKAPVSGKTVTFEIYDPTYYVDFSFLEPSPVTLKAAPQGCTVTMKKPPQMDAKKSATLSEDFFNQMSASSNFGAGYATHALVVCP